MIFEPANNENKVNKNRVLIIEWICAGGHFNDDHDNGLAAELFEQGKQMLISACEDFAESGYRVETVLGPAIEIPELHRSAITQHTLGSNSSLLDRLFDVGKDCHWILVIAPESNSALENCLNRLQPLQARLLNPSLALTRLATDKLKLTRYLQRKEVPTPAGRLLSDWHSQGAKPLDFPLVLKPVDGCGGEAVRLVQASAELEPYKDQPNWLIEEYIPGEAVSLSVILDDAPTFCQPLRQTFHEVPFGPFACCEDDLSLVIQARARKLAQRTVEALPKSSGFIGIDMVIGARDAVIEVNPRLTMSFGLLRKQHQRPTLANLMVKSCQSAIKHCRTNPMPFA